MHIMALKFCVQELRSQTKMFTKKAISYSVTSPKNSKKWRLLYYRACIDAELARNDFYRNGKVLEYFKEIIELYHLQNASWYVRPDDMVVEKYNRPLTKEELKTLAFGGTIE